MPGTEGWSSEPRSALTLWMPEGSAGAGGSASFKIDRSLFNKSFSQSASGKAEAKIDLVMKLTSYRLSTWSYSSVVKTQDTHTRDATTLLAGSGYVLGTSITVANLVAYYEALEVIAGIDRFLASGEEHEDAAFFAADRVRAEELVDD